ncbi:MAG: hypothetical protein CMQ45_02465, partial [Gammaproteobacteria bacterium]|nr:hypothetical protein [Gammaproteobacteria bacterium]
MAQANLAAGDVTHAQFVSTMTGDQVIVIGKSSLNVQKMQVNCPISANRYKDRRSITVSLRSFCTAGFILLQLALLRQLTAQELAVQTVELMQELQRYEAQLENYEFEYGFRDRRLLEPLLSIESLYESLADYERVKAIQSRRLQITRTSLGLTHPDTIPLIEALVRTDMRLNNWEQVSHHLEHLRTLAVANHGTDSEEAMLSQDRQASWFMTRVYVD